jgi:hypothetical protein
MDGRLPPSPIAVSFLTKERAALADGRLSDADNERQNGWEPPARNHRFCTRCSHGSCASWHVRLLQDQRHATLDFLPRLPGSRLTSADGSCRLRTGDLVWAFSAGHIGFKCAAPIFPKILACDLCGQPAVVEVLNLGQRIEDPKHPDKPQRIPVTVYCPKCGQHKQPWRD